MMLKIGAICSLVVLGVLLSVNVGASSNRTIPDQTLTRGQGYNLYFDNNSHCEVQCQFSSTNTTTERPTSYLALFGTYLGHAIELSPKPAGYYYELNGTTTENVHVYAEGDSRGPSAINILVPHNQHSADVKLHCDVIYCPADHNHQN